MSPQIYRFFKNARSFFGLHHTVIFITIVGLLLSLTVYSLYEVIIAPPEVSNTTNDQIDRFDKNTIGKIKDLRDSNTGDTSVTLPSTRPNPFVE